MMIKGVSVSILLLCFLVSCSNNPENENSKFEIFKSKFEKTYPKIFTKIIETPIDSLISDTLTDKEQLRRAQFCEKQLSALQRIEVEQLSPENQRDFIAIFQQLKKDLEKIEQNADLETN